MFHGALITWGFIAASFISPTSQPPDLTGLWGVEYASGPAIRGTLLVDPRRPVWRAEIAGLSVPVDRTDGLVRFTLSDNQGGFRARIDEGRAEMVGQWIQPPGLVRGNRYATPVVLTAQGGVWRGEVEPLSDDLTLYLLITRQADGSLLGYFRNPDLNFGRSNPYLVTAEEDGLRLTSTRDGLESYEASYVPSQDAIVVNFAPLGVDLALTKRDRETAAGFYPANPAASGYIYRQPAGGDGWETGSLEDVGLRAKPLVELVERVLQTEYRGFRTPYIHSLLVARHGKLALEEYFHGFHGKKTHDMRSASKTFAGTLVGVTLDNGATFDLETPVYSLFPEYQNLEHLDARKKAITVGHLLTMTSGLACDDNDDSSPGNESLMQNQETRDWYRYALDLPMARSPGGGEAVYCSAAVNLLGGVVRNAVDVPLPEFFYEHYARPLGIHHYHVNLAPSGAAYMGGGIYMRARDQLKLGQLYLDRGRWRGRRIIPAKWVDRSLRPESDFGPDHGYGYNWHVIDLESTGEKYRIYEAGGNGGQFVLIIPRLDMVVGITAGNYGDYPTWYSFLTELVPRYVISAADPGSGEAIDPLP